MDTNISEEWAILFSGTGQPWCFKRIIKREGKSLLLEDYGPYPERLTLICGTADVAKEGLEVMARFIKNEEAVCEDGLW